MKAKIRYRWDNLMEALVGAGNGLQRTEVEAMAEAGRGAVRRLRDQVQKGEIGFPKLPFDAPPLREVLRYARQWRGRYKHLLVLGIGGSALGLWALDCAVNGPYPFRRKRTPADVLILDNVDPLILARALERVNPRQTLVTVITKSGSTAETMAQFLIVREWLARKLGDREACRRISAITDPGAGDLLKMARAEGFATFAIPPNVGGRFSVLTPVGLLPAALAGIDIRKLMAGARDICEDCETEQLASNPALLAATHQVLLVRKGKSIQVIFCYSNALWGLAFWFRQLWAESLGKKSSETGQTVEAGQTPVAALGVTDQHSQLQLYMEGKRDKAFTFWEVEKPSHRLKIPKRFAECGSTAYLGGKTLNELFAAEKFAVELALTEAGRPNSTFVFPQVNEYYVGQMMQWLEYETAYAGTLLGVNAFDQPGVEEGKRLTYALLGRKGFEAYEKKIADYHRRVRTSRS